MTTHARARRTRAPVLAAVAGTAALVLSSCTLVSDTAAPTLDEALDAAEGLLSEYDSIEHVFVEPRPGRGSAEFIVPAAQSARSFTIRCLGEGDLTVRLDGEVLFADACDDTAVDLGVDDVGDFLTPTYTENRVEIEAESDVYWVAALYTTSGGGSS
ncbi:hypothetical protein C8046_03015 [Serinibacter arcticus]|uniref:Lipoprotein n=1 Tax=Serinibacter arcticus TaxID=1655435 RepID=A0A2U1ZS48_9MICO|nr:hypothetical protein [Serinibacter arcticus]PWD49815.1 hypothetical protein C8046_03015 [Serinibacter arcticus]